MKGGTCNFKTCGLGSYGTGDRNLAIPESDSGWATAS